MFAEGEDGNVLYDDHFIAVLVEDGSIHNFFDLVLVTLGEMENSLCVSLWGVPKAFAVWILANTFNDGSRGTGKVLNLAVVHLQGWGILGGLRGLLEGRHTWVNPTEFHDRNLEVNPTIDPDRFRSRHLGRFRKLCRKEVKRRLSRLKGRRQEILRYPTLESKE